MAVATLGEGAAPESLKRAGAVVAVSALILCVTLPHLPEFWTFSADATGSPAAPLCTIAIMFAIVVAAWSQFGAELHPITCRARGVEKPDGYSFHILGLSGPMLASLALTVGGYSLQMIGTPLELAHALLPFVLWHVDTRILRWANPHVEWSDEAVRLAPNYLAEYEPLWMAPLACVGVLAFEVYVQELIAGPLTLAGWPLLLSAGLIALSAGLVNHALANGLMNGVLCAEFYWTVSLMFSLSNSVLPVGLYHHLMYSMPLFMRAFDAAHEAAPSPMAHALLMHGTLGVWHLAIFSLLRLAGMPHALGVLPALPAGSLSGLPTTPSAGFGLACVGLFSLLIYLNLGTLIRKLLAA